MNRATDLIIRSSSTDKIQSEGVAIYCPACNTHHLFVKGRWNFNGDYEKPTFSPSMLVKGGPCNKDGSDRICHSFVKDGKIQYLSDCTHKYVGKTIDLPGVED